jgi:hypothetical protein
MAQACSKTLGNDGTLLGTAFTARDMVRIVDALGEDGLLRYWGEEDHISSGIVSEPVLTFGHRLLIRESSRHDICGHVP